MCQVLHTKAEDLRIHNFTDEDRPELLEEDDKTISELGFSDNHKLLVESEKTSFFCFFIDTSTFLFQLVTVTTRGQRKS